MNTTRLKAIASAVLGAMAVFLLFWNFGKAIFEVRDAAKTALRRRKIRLVRQSANHNFSTNPPNR